MQVFDYQSKAQAVYHVTANNKVLRRSYQELADRARGLAYYLRKHGFKRVGILCPNTPAFLESIYGIAAAGAVNVGACPLRLATTRRPNANDPLAAVNYRLKEEDIAYIFDHADAEIIIVDAEFVPSLESYHKSHPNVPLIVDTDTDATEGELKGPFDGAVLEGLHIDKQLGGRGWEGLEAQANEEDGLIALAYTSGTTARPKGVEYTHRGAYLAALGNVIESGLNMFNSTDRCRYLWTLPMFHAMGKTLGINHHLQMLMTIPLQVGPFHGQ